MSATAHATSRELRQAFLSFERAADHLTRSQEELLDRVRHLESELVDANRRLEAVLDAADIGVAVIDARARLLQTNASFDAWDLADEFEPLLEAPLREWIDQGGAPALRRDITVNSRDFAATCVAVDDQGKSFVLTLKDVSSIRRAEAEDSRRRRLEALGRMAAELAHEVRNPLGSMRLFAGMLQQDLEQFPDQQRMVDQILAGVAGLEATVSNLLNFSSERPIRRRTLDLARLTRETCAWIAPACSVRDVRLDGPDPATACTVQADAEALRQIVLNLVSNALAATDDGGSVRATVGVEEGHAVLEVVDQGRGIPAEDLRRVFDPFFSRTDGGTGLGLSIVHRLVEQHGGTIRLESRTDRGTRARVELPLHPEDS